ncbi:MAG: hypothetical protein LBQ84_08555 [Flavobacteriaceae bacterium]|jgi:hypothetical protein|nr:hypothetical protein [Flavobacteriaceae bacterium]
MNIKSNFTKNSIKFIILTFAVAALSSCSDKATLSESTALDAVNAYLNANPNFETINMEIGEVKFKSKKDAEKLQAYKELANKGYIDFELSKQKKKFLSKDSIFTYEVKLTDKSRTFVLKQKKDKIEVKAFEYQLDEDEKAKIEISGKKSGSVVVTLKKVRTDFAVLADDKNPHSPFITKTYKLKYKKEEGWIVTKDK